MLSTFLVLGLVSLANAANGGPYFAEPSYVYNFPNNNTHISEYFFYLQQINKSNVAFRADIEFKQNVGPMQARLDYLVWTGKAFTRPSGATNDYFILHACERPGVLHFLEAIEPQSGFNPIQCTFMQGNYSMDMDYNEFLHRDSPKFAYEPARVHFTVLDNGIMLFGFTIQVKFYDLNLYKFIPKD